MKLRILRVGQQYQVQRYRGWFLGWMTTPLGYCGSLPEARDVLDSYILEWRHLQQSEVVHELEVK